jgi:hypothetical protein
MHLLLKTPDDYFKVKPGLPVKLVFACVSGPQLTHLPSNSLATRIPGVLTNLQRKCIKKIHVVIMK